MEGLPTKAISSFTPSLSTLGPLLRLLRPREWIKNAFVLAPLIFSGLFLDLQSIWRATSTCLLFCLASSATYVLNDLFDFNHDGLHEKKKRTRPLVTGTVRVEQAKVLLGILYAFLIAGISLNPKVGVPIAIYLVLNGFYSWKLKQIPVLDLFCIASGFVLRVYAGAVALSVPLSSWMLVTTLCLSLYLAATKRLSELRFNGARGRIVLQYYTEALLDRYALIAAVGTILFYGLFVITMRPQLEITVPLVLFGLFRYWYITEHIGKGESPTEMLWKYAWLLLTILCWTALTVYTLWP